ncbi:DMT family transporter [Aldersonia sp. NBC_00410]|uniref:DMT family transporter n=1 Tax=Aldersonia sp. NBC_00410 TaxID=2975954 RepID=UPI002251D5B8|nr:DMT family transporter [Aldersonia sp. NBC_00410]MCX5044371.1 DMT family transporter [Aldersonia sp. NBC_00410]
MADLPLLSIALALGAALLFAVAAVAQQSAASGVAEGDSLVRGLARNPRWWAGLVGDGGGFALQVLALAVGSVLVVQPILVSSLVFALPLSGRLNHRRITARQGWLAAALCVALAVFLVIGNPTEGTADAAFREWVVPLALLLGVVVVAAAAGLSRIDASWRALLLGLAGGLLFGLAAALTEHVSDIFEHDIGAALRGWQLWALVASGVIGFYLQQRAYQVGPLTASLPAFTIAEPLGAVFIGMTVLDERLRTSGLGIVVTMLAVVVMVVTTLLLSRSQARENLPA